MTGGVQGGAAGTSRRRAVRGCVIAIVAVLLISGLVLGVKALGCRRPRDAGNPRAALDAFYAGCLNKPKISASLDEGPAPRGTVGDGRSWHHLVEYSVQYGNGGIRFLIVGQETRNSSWRVVGDEGTGP